MIRWYLLISFSLIHVCTFGQTTYYSRNDATLPRDWEDTDSWTLNSDGSGGPAASFPGRADNAVILSGHTVLIDDVSDNGSAGVSPDFARNNLGYTNVGPFNGSNADCFFQTGNIIIQDGGTLDVDVRVMLDGTSYIFGTIDVEGDLINLGIMFMTSTATFFSTDDLVLSDDSETRIDIPASSSQTNDDLYLDHTMALLCGTGGLEVGQNSDNVEEIQFYNGAFEDQICSSFTVTGCATVTNCGSCGSSCPNFTGTGSFTIDFPSGGSLVGTGGTLSYTENAVEVVDPGIDASGLTFPIIISATITISGNYIQAEDTLALIPTSGFSASWDDVASELTLFGLGDNSTWQTALRNVTYENVSEDPTTSVRTVDFTVSDGLSNSNTVSRDIDITAVNDPPDVSSITGSSTPLDYTENDGQVSVDDQITIDDPDDTNLEGATISITGNYNSSEDFLDFTDVSGISKVSFTSGVLTLTGTASLADYQAALRTVTYENISENPDIATRTIEFVVNDGDADSPPFSRDIDITRINDAPEVNGTGSSLAYTEGDGTVLIDDAVSATDVDDTNLESATVEIVNTAGAQDQLTIGTPGSLTVSNTGQLLTLTGSAALSDYITALQSVSYENTSADPDATSRTVRFIVNDGDDDSAPFDRTIDITAVNSPPEIGGGVVDDTLDITTDEDIALEVDLTASDPEGDNVSVSGGSSNDGGGTITPDGTLPLRFEYTPAADFFGLEHLELIVCDDGSPQECDTIIVRATVNPVNDAPVIVEKGIPVDTLKVMVDEDDISRVCIEVFDIDGDNITITAANAMDTNGNTQIEPDTLCFEFTPTMDYNGKAFVEVVASDDGSPVLSDTAIVELSVGPVNDPPEIVDSGVPIDTLYYTIDEDETREFCIEAMDIDGDNVYVTEGSSISDIGNVDVGALNDLCFTYQPQSDFFGTDYLEIFACDDGMPSLCDSVIITLNITGLDDPPVAVNDTVSGPQDQEITGNVLINDYDPDGDNVILNTSPINDPASGTVTINSDGSFVYMPNEEYFGEDEFVYEICDDTNPVECSQARVILSIELVPKELLVFQAVSPNGDGLNDTWYIQGINQYPDNSVRLFNRYDRLIYQAENYDNTNVKWSGQATEGMGGGEAPDGTYYYVVDLGDGSAPKKGFLVLKR